MPLLALFMSTIVVKGLAVYLKNERCLFQPQPCFIHSRSGLAVQLISFNQKSLQPLSNVHPKKTQSSLSKVSKVTPETPSLFSNQTLSLGQFELPHSTILDHEVKYVNVIIPNKETNQSFKTSTQFLFGSPSTPFLQTVWHVRDCLEIHLVWGHCSLSLFQCGHGLEHPR